MSSKLPSDHSKTGSSSSSIRKSEIASEQPALNGTPTESGIRSKFPNQPSPDHGPNVNIEWLDLSRSVIEKKETKILARDLESGRLPNLKVLFLERNAEDVGMMAMLNALRAGHLKRLEKFILWEVSSYNQITTAEEGTDTIAAALEAGNLPNLHRMDLTGSLPKLIPARKFSKVITELVFRCSCGGGRLWEGYQICKGCLFCSSDPEKNQALECLRCSCGRLQEYSGNDGIGKIGRALDIKPHENLRVLKLKYNYIGDKGACSLAKILRRGRLPHLVKLDLQHNPVGYKGAKKIVSAYLKNPLLTARVRLDWPDFLLQEQAAGFRDNNIRLEYRLTFLKIHPDTIVKEHIEFEPRLERRPAGCFQRRSYRLHLLCQANCGRASHEVEPSTEGIEIRSRSMGHSSSKRHVQRDVVSDSTDKAAKVDPQDPWKSDDDSDLDGPPRVRRPGTRPKKIFITSKSFRFFRAEKLGGMARAGWAWKSDTKRHMDTIKAEKEEPSRPAYMAGWPWKDDTKRKRQMDSISMELLIMAERKPDEFFAMFGLRQVLLENSSCENKYSRVWLCKSCYNKGHPEKVHPITTDDEVEPKVEIYAPQQRYA